MKLSRLLTLLKILTTTRPISIREEIFQDKNYTGSVTSDIKRKGKRKKEEEGEEGKKKKKERNKS